MVPEGKHDTRRKHACSRHAVVVSPGLRDHHHDDLWKFAACHHQQFHRVVEFSRVATVHFDNRFELLKAFAKEFTLHQALASCDPVPVSTQRVDFTVVSHPAKWLSAGPGWQGVGGESRVHHRQVTGESPVLQIWIIERKLRRGQHSFVNKDSRRKRTHIEHVPFVESCFSDIVRDALANQVQLSFEVVLAYSIGWCDECLNDFGLLSNRRCADVSAGRVDRDLSPANESLTAFGSHVLKHLLATLARSFIRRQKDVSDTKEIAFEIEVVDLGHFL